jgi:hypothetical protein
VIGEMLAMPCENAGIAVGIGLDDIFIRYLPLLHAGDVVYMPMELQQYTVTRTQNRSGADGAILLRQDRRLLAALPADRVLGAMFCCNLADLLESFAESTTAQAGLFYPKQILSNEYNEDGDRMDNLPGTADPALLRNASRTLPDAGAVQSGYGTTMIATFVTQASRRGVTVIGGLPTQFDTAALSPALVSTIANIYQANGGRFIALSNQSEYPVEDFFNSEDHLMQPCQFMHSIAVADLLARFLSRHPEQVDQRFEDIALTCPSAQAMSAAR